MAINISKLKSVLPNYKPMQIHDWIEDIALEPGLRIGDSFIEDIILRDRKMDINILGAGYVGLTLGIFIANQGFKVIMIDNDKSKIDQLRSGISQCETGIQEALDFSIKSNNINFTTKLIFLLHYG